MSRRHDVQDATGVLEFLSGYGNIVAWPGNAQYFTGNGVPKNGLAGFAPGCTWQNVKGTPGTLFYINKGTNLSSNWLQLDGSPNGAGVLTQFGAAAVTNPLTPFAAFAEEGNLYRNCGNPIKSNGADTTDDILDGFVLPANAFDLANRQLMLNFNGNLAATGNNKRIKIWVNPTMAGQTVTAGVISGGTVTAAGSGVLLFDSGVQTGNNVGWQIDVIFCKFGANGSNTQYSIGASMFGATHGGSTLGIFPTQAENAIMNFVVTGSSPTTGAAGDVILNQTEINAMN